MALCAVMFAGMQNAKHTVQKKDDAFVVTGTAWALFTVPTTGNELAVLANSVPRALASQYLYGNKRIDQSNYVNPAWAIVPSVAATLRGFGVWNVAALLFTPSLYKHDSDVNLTQLAVFITLYARLIMRLLLLSLNVVSSFGIGIAVDQY